MNPLLLAVAAFFIGSFPTGLIIAKARGIDPRKKGSGNIGATNVLRSAGKWPAFFTLAGDMAKGAVAVVIARYFFDSDFYYQGLAGLCAVLGHNFSLFLKFRGGKGVATSLGVMLIYSPLTGLIVCIIWLMTVFVTKYSSLSALVSFGIMPFVLYLADSAAKLPAALLISAMIFIRHRQNISRLISGTEPRVGQKA